MNHRSLGLHITGAALLGVLPLACFEASAGDSDATKDGTGTADATVGDTGPSPTSGADSTASTSTDPTDPTDPADVTGSSTDGPSGDCSEHADCSNPALPFCRDGACVDCGALADPDGECMDASPMLPYCDGTECVGCTEDAHCSDETPICDAATKTCVGCTYHEQCPGAACDIFDGTCMSTSDVVWVDTSCFNGPPGLGSEASPHCTFAPALDEIGPGESAVIFIRGSVLDTPIVVTGDRTVAIIAPDEGAVFSSTSASEGTDLVQVSAATLYLDNVAIRESRGDRGTDVNTGARLGIDRTIMAAPRYGAGVYLEDSQLLARNCAIGFAGSAFLQDSYGILADGSTMDILYSSIVHNVGNAGNAGADGIYCFGGSSGTLRNSIVFENGSSGGGAVDCPGLEVSYTATNEAIPGDGNVEIGVPLTDDYFVDDYHAVDLHLTPGGPGIPLFEDVAVWEYGDPPTDIDGDPRPRVPGAADYAGIDIP